MDSREVGLYVAGVVGPRDRKTSLFLRADRWARIRPQLGVFILRGQA